MGRTIRHPKTEPAEVEFPYVPAAVPVIADWDQLADAALSRPELAPALLHAIEVHDRTGARTFGRGYVDLLDDSVFVRAALTDIANGGQL
jgi:hypothetical protein